MYNNNIKTLYNISFPKKELSRKNDVWIQICKYLQRFINLTDTVVYVACGYGEFINNINAGKKSQLILILKLRILLLLM